MRKQRRWNLLATLALLLAVILAFVAITRIDITPVQTRDSLRLSTSARSLTVDPRQLPPSGWTTLRGELLNAGEARVDQDALEAAPLHAQLGVYANTTSELDLSVPSYSASGYIWMVWDGALQAYL